MFTHFLIHFAATHIQSLMHNHVVCICASVKIFSPSQFLFLFSQMHWYYHNHVQ